MERNEEQPLASPAADLHARLAALEARIERLERALPAHVLGGSASAAQSTLESAEPSAAGVGVPQPVAPTDLSKAPASTAGTALWGPASGGRQAPPLRPTWQLDGTNQPVAPGGAMATEPNREVRRSLIDLEERFAPRLLAWTGGAALIAAAVFLLSLAFTRGWIGEEARVAIGLVAGGLAFAAGARFLLRDNPLLGHVLTAVGLGIISISLLAATRLYGLVSPDIGLLAALVVSGAAAWLAVRTSTQVVAAFGLVSALMSPPLIGASPTTLTLGFVAVTLIGTTTVALFRSWRWLPTIAFLLAAPQVAAWLLGDSPPVEALLVTTGFWVINLIASGGEELRRNRPHVPASGSLLAFSSALFLLLALSIVLDDELVPWRAGAFAIYGVLHLAVAAWYLRTRGLEHRFGNTTAAAGLMFVTIALAVQVGAIQLPAAWAVEAVAVLGVAVRFRHRWSAMAALLLGSLSVAHLLIVSYPMDRLGDRLFNPPFFHAEFITLLVMLAALAVAAVLVRPAWARAMIGAAAMALLVWVGPFELAGVALVAWLAAVGVASAAVQRVVSATGDDDRVPAPAWARAAMEPATWLAGLSASLAALVALSGRLNPAAWGTVAPPAIPFSDDRALAGAILVAGQLGIAYLAPASLARPAAALAALATTAYVIPFEVYADGVVILWCALAAVALLTRWLPARLSSPAGGLLLAGAATVAFAIVASPVRLAVYDASAVPSPLLPAWPGAFLALAAVLAVVPRERLSARLAPLRPIGAVAALVYTASIGIVSMFQGQVGASDLRVEELATQAQVALSVLWTGIGATAVVVGLARGFIVVRQAGLVLLGLATVKVFLVDLAALDVAYRVLSLAALGLLLLASAYAFTRLRRSSGMRRATTPPS